MLHGLIHSARPAARWPSLPGPTQQRRKLLTLAIETSCDDTCVAILSRSCRHGVPGPDGPQRAQLHFHEKITARNTGHGGIHPIEALDSHRSSLAKLIDKSLRHLPVTSAATNNGENILTTDGDVKQKPDFISVTRGPGMRSNLSCGLDTAKGLATAWQIPMVGVHHMQAHTLTPRLVHAMAQKDESISTSENDTRLKPAFPFLTLLISGGHTMLVHSHSLLQHSILASTLDVAIGDTLDKCGRIILPDSIKSTTTDTAYGKYLSRYAFATPASFADWPIPSRRSDETDKPPNKYGWALQSPLSQTRDLAFSFAGIASRISSLMTTRSSSPTDDERLLLARSALGVSFEHLASRTVIALEALRSSGTAIPTLVVSGGVAANDFLRWFLRETLDARGFGHVDLVFPPVELCTDNAAMIAWAGLEMFEAGYTTDVGCNAIRKWSMDSTSADGGILGVGGWKKKVCRKGDLDSGEGEL